MILKTKKGFSLIELQVTIIIAAILILIIGVISDASLGSYNKIKKEGEVFSDIYYGFKLLQNRVHAANNVTSGTLSSPWITTNNVKIIINNTERYGLYQPAGTTTIELVRFASAAAELTPSSRETILSIPINATWANPTLALTQSGNSYTITLTGTKDNVPFNLSSTSTKRIQ